MQFPIKMCANIWQIFTKTMPVFLILFQEQKNIFGQAQNNVIYKVGKELYTGYQNVWHEVTESHIAKTVGDASTDLKVKRNLCANLCTLDSSCDAFYLDDKASGNCHLVEEEVNRTVGHGLRTDNVYYVKTVESQNAFSIIRPEELVPPCDLDVAVLTAEECSSLDQNVTYYTCPDSTSGYQDSVNLVSDKRCSHEDRLLQCEMQDEEVLSNIVTNRKALFDKVFFRTSHEPEGLVSTTNVDFMVISFKNAPKRITRVILRSTYNNHDHIRKGQLIIHQSASQNVVDFEFTLTTQCALMINFETLASQYPLAASADKLELRPLTWFGVNDHAFKMDVFVAPV